MVHFVSLALAVGTIPVLGRSDHPGPSFLHATANACPDVVGRVQPVPWRLMDRVAHPFCSSFPGPGGPRTLEPPPFDFPHRPRQDNPGSRWIRPPGPELGPPCHCKSLVQTFWDGFSRPMTSHGPGENSVLLVFLWSRWSQNPGTGANRLVSSIPSGQSRFQVDPTTRARARPPARYSPAGPLSRRWAWLRLAMPASYGPGRAPVLLEFLGPGWSQPCKTTAIRFLSSSPLG